MVSNLCAPIHFVLLYIGNSAHNEDISDDITIKAGKVYVVLNFAYSKAGSARCFIVSYAQTSNTRPYAIRYTHLPAHSTM